MPLTKRLACPLLALVLAGCSASSDSTPSQNTVSPSQSAVAPTVRGTVLLDGSINGCGGETALVAVRDGATDVASQVAHSTTRGLDCVFDFSLPVPVATCYELDIEHQPVGIYPADPGGGVEVGIVLASSVYGDPASGAKPALYADFDGSDACKG